MFFADSLTKLVGSLTGYRDRPIVVGPGAYANLYNSGSWLYRAAVDRIAIDCFRRGYKWVADSEDISKIEQLQKRHQIVDKKQQALQLARLDGEGYLYFDDGGKADKELLIETAGDLRFVNVIRGNSLSKMETDNNPLSPYFGQPSMYRFGNVDVHPSRICRFVANRDPATGNGVPTLQIVAEIIDKATCTRNHIVDLVGEARIDVIRTPGLMEAVSDPEGLANVQRKVETTAAMKANLSILAMDKEEEYDQKSSSFATLPDVLESMRREVSAALEIPHAVLFGREGGLGTNGEMELVTYRDTIATMQKTMVEPACELLDALTVKTATGRVPDGDIYLEWLPLKQPTDAEMQEMGDKIATRHKTLIDAGFDRSVLEGPTINALVEAGVAPGLEASWDEWLKGGRTNEDDNEEGDI